MISVLAIYIWKYYRKIHNLLAGGIKPFISMVVHSSLATVLEALLHSLGWKLITHSPIGWLLISRIYGKGEMFIRSQLTSILVATFSNLLNSEVVQKSTQQLNGKFNQE